ncbi:MAG: HAMP domain-containing histidine kinase [Phycisphaerales bacterium]|nr:MAG: HAMP domain-containing histidine kinase [Phycisphaerales bacterium]
MYKRLVILSVIILVAICGLIWMGYYSIRIRAQGMEGTRLGEFAAVAEQIRQDVKRKLDEFMQTEQNRAYTDYQYYYVPETIAPGQQQMPVLRSPLGGRLDHGLAYGNFQIEPDGMVTTPNEQFEQTQVAAGADAQLRTEALANRLNIENNLLPVLNGTASGSLKVNLYGAGGYASPIPGADRVIASAKGSTPQGRQGKNFPIESLQAQGQKTQVIEQKRSVVERNIASNTATQMQQRAQKEVAPQVPPTQPPPSEQTQAETVQVRIEPFVPLVVPGEQAGQNVFGGQVFLLRHVQIEDNHFLQGFQLNEERLIEEVEESASRLMRDGMSFELAGTGETGDGDDVAYAAILDFGFGDLVLNLKEVDPDWIRNQINHLQLWYFSTVGVVLFAVALALVSLWSNATAQIRLARKKDDFISAVSHELRTPLTSIRMYAEMLEKKWVKSQDKAAEYYRNMRQESERLSRLVENVLDFSRIQRGRKKYTFNMGDINECIAHVVEMMAPWAGQRGFSIRMELGTIAPSAFDSDAVTQVVMNLLDNAIKYARDAEDKTITVRTASDGRFVLIEVEDHGPGILLRQRNKIFEAFYRSGAEATRETTGTGLGLALVKKFVEAHDGFVEIVNVRPTGAIFRVGLPARIR